MEGLWRWCWNHLMLTAKSIVRIVIVDLPVGCGTWAACRVSRQNRSGERQLPRRDSKTPGKHGGNSPFSESGAESGGVDIQSGALWAEIRALIDACPDLSP